MERRRHLTSFSLVAVLHVCATFLPRASAHTVGRGLGHVLLSVMSLPRKQEGLWSIEASAPE